MKGTAEGRKMQDKIETIGRSVIQHGKVNNRIYIMKLASGDAGKVTEELEKLAKQEKYTKIFAKVQPDALPVFLVNGYQVEAFIPKFYKNSADCLLVSKFIDINRKKVPVSELDQFFELLTRKTKKNQTQQYNQKYETGELTEKDAPAISAVFSQVFETYPFPVHDPEYIVKTMQEEGTRYFGVKDKTRLIAASTAEIDYKNRNAEMTDFAVLPEYRGRKLAFHVADAHGSRDEN